MIYLHIGRTKTGTTALQAFLGANQEALARVGLHFPGGFRGNAHHDAALALTPKRMKRASESARRLARAELEKMQRIVESDRDTVISSEMFQQADPALVAAIFPPNKTRIIVYLREQLEYLISAYAQRIQVSLAQTPFARYAARFSPDYFQFLESWAQHYGRENILVGVYDRNLLRGSDVRRDFLSLLNIPEDGFRFTTSKSGNPTIDAELLEFKGALNALVPPQIHDQFDIAAALSQIARDTPKLQPSETFAAEYRSRFKNNETVAESYLQGRRIPVKQLSGAGVVLKHSASIESGLLRLAAADRALARQLSPYLTKDAVQGLQPLLPADWDQATGIMKRGVQKRREKYADL